LDATIIQLHTAKAFGLQHAEEAAAEKIRDGLPRQVAERFGCRGALPQPGQQRLGSLHHLVNRWRFRR
jgi:hypothetical protein